MRSTLVDENAMYNWYKLDKVLVSAVFTNWWFKYFLSSILLCRIKIEVESLPKNCLKPRNSVAHTQAIQMILCRTF